MGKSREKSRERGRRGIGKKGEKEAALEREREKERGGNSYWKQKENLPVSVEDG